MLELVLAQPDWLNALGVALTRPPGVPERRLPACAGTSQRLLERLIKGRISAS